LRKSRLLADAGALLRVVAPEIEAQLRELVTASGGECLLRGYQEADLDGCGLIIAATDDEPLNAQVSSDAHRRCVPVNVVDAPQLCSVIFPAIVDRSPLVIAVSSGGDAPVLARLIRAKIETWIPSTYGQLAGLAARFRNQVKTCSRMCSSVAGSGKTCSRARLPTGNWPGRAPKPSVCCRPRLMARRTSPPVRCIWWAPGRVIRTC
jgi:uroporphyrin-III C-methyltransferase/precorrin-2 dehydrogenase/sirohydrochlorin ferrochelatase